MSHLSVLCDKLTVAQLVKKFPAFCATRRFIALFIEHPVIAPTKCTMFIHYAHFTSPSVCPVAVTQCQDAVSVDKYRRMSVTYTHVVTDGTCMYICMVNGLTLDWKSLLCSGWSSWSTSRYTGNVTIVRTNRCTCVMCCHHCAQLTHVRYYRM
jgi:hypothetical protein